MMLPIAEIAVETGKVKQREEHIPPARYVGDRVGLYRMDRKNKNGQKRGLDTLSKPAYQEEHQNAISQVNQYIGEMKSRRILSPHREIHGVRDVAQRPIRSQQQFGQILWVPQQGVPEHDRSVIEDKAVSQTVCVAERN